ncbi:MAG: proline--tRNA ligase [Halobacteriovoraceae bacterium]|jgi:prolyl-tRNA synthetase|nr:proline--tRNA ligase [Halobacteriovoraceae bacterium]
MKLSQAFWQTYKETPADAEIPSHQLLIRAGFLSKTTGGIYTYCPMAVRVLRKIKEIVRVELNKVGAQEILMSFVTPGELWKQSGRWETMGPEMVRLKDRKDSDFCLSATNEETITNVISKTITSYKQLPVNLYQFNTKFRDEMRPRFGLIRCREFIMKDGYSFHQSKESLDEVYKLYYQAYEKAFNKMGLNFIVVEADGGAMADAGAQTHEFQAVADNGEDDIVEAKSLNYAANVETAETYRKQLDFAAATDLDDVETINMGSCTEVANFLDLPIYQTLKTLVYTVSYPKKDVTYIVMLLGDDELNEVKFTNFLKGATGYEAASANELARLKMPAGYMSPIKIDAEKTVVIYDTAIDLDAAYVVGANKENYHTRGFVPSRDTLLSPKHIDLRLSRQGDLGPDKKTPIVFKKGIEVGHIFQLGDKYTKSMGVTVLDQNGKKTTPVMGCYGMGISRIMAATIEQHHDGNGIIWPTTLAPFDIYFAVIGKKDSTKKLSVEIYDDLVSQGFDVILDDRGMGPGSMFKDADLLGLPLRILLGERDFDQTKELEIKIRKTGESFKVKQDNLAAKVKELLSNLGDI